MSNIKVMDKLNNSGNLQQTNDEFKVWLKKFHEQLATKDQSLKLRFSLKEQSNKKLKNNIEKLLNNSLDTSCLAIDVIPIKIRTQVEADFNHLKIKSDQLYKCNEGINAKVGDETKKMRNKFYEIITKDEVALKPYHEVEKFIVDLNLTTDTRKREQKVYKENFVKKLKQRECYFNEIQQSILMMEPIEQEMRTTVQNCNKSVAAKLKFLNLKSIDDANTESNELKELLAEIANMKSQLYSQ